MSKKGPCVKHETVLMYKECPICEMGQLTLHTERVTVEHLGQQGQIDSQYAVCDYCGSEQAGADEVLKNKQAMIAFQSEVEKQTT